MNYCRDKLRFRQLIPFVGSEWQLARLCFSFRFVTDRNHELKKNIVQTEYQCVSVVQLHKVLFISYK